MPLETEPVRQPGRCGIEGPAKRGPTHNLKRHRGRRFRCQKTKVHLFGKPEILLGTQIPRCDSAQDIVILPDVAEKLVPYIKLVVELLNLVSTYQVAVAFFGRLRGDKTVPLDIARSYITSGGRSLPTVRSGCLLRYSGHRARRTQPCFRLPPTQDRGRSV